MKSKNNKTSLGSLVEKFFHQYLISQKGVSQNTIASYSDCLRILFVYGCESLGKKIDTLTFEDIDDKLVLDFLDHLEQARGNTPQSRNNRLAAIRSFMRYAAIEEPTLVAQCTRICQIPTKKSPHRQIGSLEEQEVSALLETPDRNTLLGSRDYAMLLLFYNSGARVQEIVDLKIDSVRWDAPYQVTLHGKGNKERVVPLWPETIQALEDYRQKRKNEAQSGEQHLFLNARGQALSRFGVNHIVRKLHEKAAEKCPTLKDKKVSPHTFRHTTALHLIRSGNAISVVKEWLGHADINTTHHYVEIDMKMKEQALAACEVPSAASSPRTPPWHQPDLLDWLEGLGRPSKLCGATGSQAIAIPA